MDLLLSPSLENYLKMILILQQSGNSVRVTDLAKKLNIAKSSVNQAVGVLKKQGLVRHERYGPLELTDVGITVARGIARRHELLMKFMIDVLKVDPEVAKNDACLMEHAVSPTTIEKLSNYMEQLIGNTCEDETTQIDKSSLRIIKKLDTILPGTRVKVVKLVSKETMGHRLSEMGITPGVEIVIEAYAPMGDPIEIKLRGYSLAIRKSEAMNVFVEVI